MLETLPVRTAYTLLGNALTPGLRYWFKRRAQRGKEDPFRLNERFGHASIARPAGTVVWLHAASVGEAQSVLTLVRALLQQHPYIHLLITTGTVTSAALIAQQNFPRVIHQFLPADTQASVERFLEHWKPHLVLWVESELWPQLLWQIRRRFIPALLINARISEKTKKGWKNWPATARSLLGCFRTIYAGSPDDAARLNELGAQNIKDVGNLKYDAAPLPVDTRLLEFIGQQARGRLIFAAASTHANEEQLLAETHQIVAQQFPQLLTIIIPRHNTRGDAIAADLRARGLTVAQRSKSESITPETAIYLADTMGELGSFYRISDLVFMGGSLVPHGGQNPLEAARLGNTMLTGPYTHNFTSIIKNFVANDAIRVAADQRALAEEIIALLANIDERRAMAKRASTVVEQARGASTIILQQCREILARSGA